MSQKEPRFSQLCLATVPLAKEISGNLHASGRWAIVHCLVGFQTNAARRIAKEWVQKKHPGSFVLECRVQSYLSLFEVMEGDRTVGQYILFPDRNAKVVS